MVSVRPLLLSASTQPIERLYARQAQLLTFYEHGRARLWDVSAGQMQKALTHVEAVEVIGQMDGWQDL